MIGGNLTAVLQVRTTTKNAIGESVESWNDVMSLKGFLDLASGESKYTTYNAKIQESTHIFICDFALIPSEIEVGGINIPFSSENARMVANSQKFDVLLIDNPMELNKHIEILLKYTGGQNG